MKRAVICGVLKERGKGFRPVVTSSADGKRRLGPNKYYETKTAALTAARLMLTEEEYEVSYAEHLRLVGAVDCKFF